MNSNQNKPLWEPQSGPYDADTLLDIKDCSPHWYHMNMLPTRQAAIEFAASWQQQTEDERWPAFEFVADGRNVYARFVGMRAYYDRKRRAMNKRNYGLYGKNNGELANPSKPGKLSARIVGLLKQKPHTLKELATALVADANNVRSCLRRGLLGKVHTFTDNCKQAFWTLASKA